ncbi:MAG TPA: zf-HC2 domain-containing protein [Vicinamibacterales bacterium]|nr:zf-HC2 domain-containing protein [Vicinamibacterales bacterium]
MTSNSHHDGGLQAPQQRASCSKVVALLADYLEEQLPPARHAELTRHLETCSSCLAQLKTYRSTVSLLRSLREEDLPSDLRLMLSTFLNEHAVH